jgi:ubiquinone/menaquinone biosynthesis C-methylase UbiE
VRDYYEELWERLPDPVQHPDLMLRLGFLLAEARREDRALDLGCGDGAFTELLAKAVAEVVGADVAQSALRRARAHNPSLEFRLVPIDGPLPFDDNAFELVWSSEVIEHVADTARWLSEARRVLVPGGRLLLTTPNHARLAIAVRGVERYSEPLGDHLHLYTRRSLTEVLHEFGFADVGVRAVGGAPGLRRLLLARAVR